jgi:hypothetical protein
MKWLGSSEVVRVGLALSVVAGGKEQSVRVVGGLRTVSVWHWRGLSWFSTGVVSRFLGSGD